MRGRIRRVPVVVATVVASIALAVPAVLFQFHPAQASAALVGPLHTTGNQIYDASGQTVRLRGLTRDGLERSTTGWNISEDEIDHARTWGANVIRIPLSEDFWNQGCMLRSYDWRYVGLVDDVVNWITSRGMVAMLSLTFNPRYACDSQSNNIQKMADAPGALTFWRSVAIRYQSNPLVAFELYNEPHDISDSVWLRGGTVQDLTTIWTAAGMQQMYDTVRATGAQNLVFVPGQGWASGVPSLTVSGHNIVYSAHMYTCPLDPPPNCTPPTDSASSGFLIFKPPPGDPYDPTIFFNRWKTFKTTHPLVITEFGWPNGQDGRYNANVINMAEQQGLGWLAFAWDGTATSKFTLVANAGPGANYDPSPAGEPVKNGMALP